MQLSITPPHRFAPGQGVTVVIDVFRFTTTASVLSRRAETPIWVVPTLEDLPRLELARGHRLIFSELEACRDWPERCDNSPIEANQVDLAGRTPVMITTNGTRTVGAALPVSDSVLLGSFVNFQAILDHLNESRPERVTLAPAGRFDRQESRLEDDLCAQAYYDVLRGEEVDFEVIRRRCFEDPRTLRRIEGEGNFEADAEFALSLNRAHVVPEATAVHTSGASGIARVERK